MRTARKITVSVALLSVLFCVFGLFACEKTSPEHTHTYATEWTMTDTQHYRAATCEHSDLKKDLGDHDTNGKDGACSVCSYMPEKHRHDWSAWTSDNETTHTRNCSVCKKTETKPHNMQLDTCMDCGYSVAPASLISIENATIDFENSTANMVADKTTNSVNLSQKVKVSMNSGWKLYDSDGTTLIPTKIAQLANRETTFYITVTSADGLYENTYALKIYKSFEVNITYLGIYGETIHTETADTGYEYEINYVPEITGYTFNYWKLGGEQTAKFTPFAAVTLDPDCTANKYNFTLNPDGGTASQTEKQITFDGAFTLPVPERKGYTFTGWYADTAKITDSNGASLSNSKFAAETEVTAHWQANSYSMTVECDDVSHGSVAGEDVYYCDSSVTVTATTYRGYDFIGWYNGDTKLSGDLSYTFSMPSEDTTYTAKWQVKPEMRIFDFTSSETDCTITELKNTNVKVVVIPNYVTSIGDAAFQSCYGLTSITIPDSVISIENGAFFNCTGLTSINIPDSVSVIDDTTFSGCEGLTSITIPNNVTTIGSSAFFRCVGLTSITIPDSVSTIGDRAFIDCYRLTSITIPNSVTSIDEMAFSNCNGLTIYCEAAEKPSGWVYNWNYSSCPVVWNCNNNDEDAGGYKYAIINGVRYALKGNEATVTRQPTTISGAITIPDSVIYKEQTYSVTTIGREAFSDCEKLTSITIPDSVTAIGREAFERCGLKSITIPDSVTTIEGYVFQYCGSLTIYCEAAEKPSGWSMNWNNSNYTVVWDCKNK